jgi:hypothetical protein
MVAVSQPLCQIVPVILAMRLLPRASVAIIWNVLSCELPPSGLPNRSTFTSGLIVPATRATTFISSQAIVPESTPAAAQCLRQWCDKGRWRSLLRRRRHAVSGGARRV